MLKNIDEPVFDFLEIFQTESKIQNAQVVRRLR